ncbi:MAG TPA: hypothetical protein PKE40_01270 [Arachnia sp.]|nr:hypothetical protein [Arachnia sp.]HMT84958.1 hypothetical protein [Arachnia sp.]
MRQRVTDELARAIPILRDLLQNPAEEARFQRLVEQLWVPAEAVAPPMIPPGGLRHFHRYVPDDVWEQTVSWLHGETIVARDNGEEESFAVTLDEVRGWAVDLHLADDLVTPPAVTGAGKEKPPLNRSVFYRLAMLMKEYPHLVDEGLDPEGLLEREVSCAAAPLGLPSSPARAVLMLGYWLVVGRAFDATREEFGVVPAELVVDDGVDEQVREEAAHFHRLRRAQAQMYRDVWARIRLMAGAPRRRSGDRRSAQVLSGTRVGAAGPKEGVTADGMARVAESEGSRVLGAPEQSYMKRLWSRVHTYSHRGALTPELAAELLTEAWGSWVNDTGSLMGVLPDASSDQPERADLDDMDEFWLMLQWVTADGTDRDVIALLLKIKDADYPSELKEEWQRTVERAGIPDETRADSEIDDVALVAGYLKKHMR